MREHHSNYPYKDYGDNHENRDVDESGTLYRFHDIYISPPGESYRKVIYDPFDKEDRDLLRIPLVSSDLAGGGSEAWPVEIGSVLDVLRRVSDRLVKACGYAWREEHAAWFVLTGEASPSIAMEGHTETAYGDIITRGAITLTAEPWMPAETVLRYRRMQTAMLQQDNRPLSDKNLALFRFVVGRYRDAVPDIEKPAATSSSASGDWEVNLTPSYQMTIEGDWEEDLSPFEGALPETEVVRG